MVANSHVKALMSSDLQPKLIAAISICAALLPLTSHLDLSRK